MKMEKTERSVKSAHKIQTPGYHTKKGESLELRKMLCFKIPAIYTVTVKAKENNFLRSNYN